MKTIRVSDDMFAFLVELQKGRKESNNRGTASVVYGIIDKEYIYNVDEYADDSEKILYDDEGNILTIENIEDPEWIGDYEYDHDVNFSSLGIKSSEKIWEYLKEHGWQENSRRLIETPMLNLGSGLFISEQKAFDFIKCNRHNLHDPSTYGYSAHNNSELIGIIDFIEKTDFVDVQEHMSVDEWSRTYMINPGGKNEQ